MIDMEERHLTVLLPQYEEHLYSTAQVNQYINQPTRYEKHLDR